MVEESGNVAVNSKLLTIAGALISFLLAITVTIGGWALSNTLGVIQKDIASLEENVSELNSKMSEHQLVHSNYEIERLKRKIEGYEGKK